MKYGDIVATKQCPAFNLDSVLHQTSMLSVSYYGCLLLKVG